MKFSMRLLLCIGSLSLPLQAQFHPIGSSKPLPDSVAPNVIMAVEDEIYDYKQECFWQVAVAHFGGLIWPTLGTLSFRG
jgi:hypothetical protein